MQMNILYDYKNETWVSSKPVYFGKNHLPLHLDRNQTGSFFKVKEKNGRVGPLIGILTSKENREDFFGNRNTFKNIQVYLQENDGGISFVMTPEGIKEETIEGFLYDEGEWRKAIFPLPDIIYNRVASYKSEKLTGVKKVRKLASSNGIPFYNPHFFEKWETYKQLAQNEILKKHLPPTDKLIDKRQLAQWLKRQSSIIIKPVLSSKGDGITVISNNNNGFEIKTNKGCIVYSLIDHVWEKLNDNLKNRRAIVQKNMNVNKYKGNQYDLRILVQRVKDTWLISGIGVRCARQGAITTHVPQGGKIIPLTNVIHELNIDLIEQLAFQIASQLEIAYGYLCEFSIDIGVDKVWHPWIFEVNAKPMKFDEPHIKEKAMYNLIQCFYYDSGFK